MKYLGVVFDKKRNFGQHLVAVTTKAERSPAAISRILPNVGGSRSSKRAVLCGSLHNILFCGAPVWVNFLKIRRYENLLVWVQRNMLLRVVSVNKTVALQVITATIPVDLMANAA